jgi:hypothetical protein
MQHLGKQHARRSGAHNDNICSHKGC